MKEITKRHTDSKSNYERVYIDAGYDNISKIFNSYFEATSLKTIKNSLTPGQNYQCYFKSPLKGVLKKLICYKIIMLIFTTYTFPKA